MRSRQDAPLLTRWVVWADTSRPEEGIALPLLIRRGACPLGEKCGRCPAPGDMRELRHRNSARGCLYVCRRPPGIGRNTDFSDLLGRNWDETAQGGVHAGAEPRPARPPRLALRRHGRTCATPRAGARSLEVPSAVQPKRLKLRPTSKWSRHRPVTHLGEAGRRVLDRMEGHGNASLSVLSVLGRVAGSEPGR